MKVRVPRIFSKQPKPEGNTGITDAGGSESPVEDRWTEDEEGGQTASLEQVGFELVIPEVS